MYSRKSPPQIWTSTRRRAHHTAWPFVASINQASQISNVSTTVSGTLQDLLVDPDSESPPTPAASQPPMPAKIKVIEKPQMLEINPGIWDGLNMEQAKKYYPEDWDRFTKDPYSYRVPRSESYHDLSGMDAISNVRFLTYDIPL